MRAFVFTDKALARQAGRFVWLAIDTERPENAAFVAKFPITSWPTLLVLDPRSEKAALRWLGSATVPQLERLLDDGEHAVRGDAAGLEGELARADALYADGHPAEAAERLGQLVARAPADWSRRPRAVESLVVALMDAKRPEDCARTARAEGPRLPRSPSLANVAGVGLSCALQAPREAPWRKDAIAALEILGQSALAPPPIEMAADDRSGLYESLVQAREDAGDAEGERALAARWATFLEGEAERAPSPEARAVFDSHRLEAYRMLGEPARALPMLQASERALPQDYNPPARLAATYQALKRYDEALAANDRALARVYGPRKLRVLSQRASILREKGDLAAARKTLGEALAFARTLPPAQVPPHTLESLQKMLDGLE
jgi:tetratricopeptide (TPR) repeat protein